MHEVAINLTTAGPFRLGNVRYHHWIIFGVVHLNFDNIWAYSVALNALLKV